MNSLLKNRRVVARRNCYLERAAFHYDTMKEYNQHPSIVIGKMDKTCGYCGVKQFKGETLHINPYLCPGEAGQCT